MAHRNGRTNAQLIAHLRYKLRAAEYQRDISGQHWREQRDENILLKGRITNLESTIAAQHADLNGDICTIDDLRARLRRAEDNLQEQRESFNKAFRELEAAYHKVDDRLQAEQKVNGDLGTRLGHANERINQLIDVAHAIARNS